MGKNGWRGGSGRIFRMLVLCYSAGDIFASYLIFAAWPQISVCCKKKVADAPFLPLRGPLQSADTGPCQKLD